MRGRAVLAAFAIVAGLGPGASLALAAKASLSIPLGGVGVFGNVLQSTGYPTFYANVDSGIVVSFVLPRDYRANTPVSLVFAMTAGTSAPCGFYFDAQQVKHLRGGRAVATETGMMSPANGDPVADIAADGVIRNKGYVLKASAAIGDLKAGDAIIAYMRRRGTHAADTCTGTQIYGIEVRYSSTG